ncbi:hypothetical protein [Roseicyclus persicicus]|uniref:Uncharacterized protein n=1 Tax=Roseicyclus persicicus TaxID=2650661 RepID=A0A7X6GXB1_9RHOB|nr:hypothetical protein [Roseibacterium persicicum]NKX44028.1 hypothetical protein [Roseibacterium persicicum]
MLAVAALIGAAALTVTATSVSGPAWAQTGGHGGGGGGGGGHEEGGHEEGGGGGHGGGGQGGGHGGGDEGTEGGSGNGQGGQGGQAGQGGGGRPPWAAEGIPEVELGRLNVARAPGHVLDRAYDEALAQLAAMAGFYNLSLDQMIVELQTNWDALALIDSPLQNLSLLRDALDGTLDLSAYGITNDRDTLMAAFLGVATDKAVPVTTETVIALSIILEMPMSEADAAVLAARAEAIRQAVVIGHG